MLALIWQYLHVSWVKAKYPIHVIWAGARRTPHRWLINKGWFLQIFTVAGVFEPGDEWTIMIVIEVYNCRQQRLPLSQANALGFDSDLTEIAWREVWAGNKFQKSFVGLIWKGCCKQNIDHTLFVISDSFYPLSRHETNWTSKNIPLVFILRKQWIRENNE